MRCHCSRMINIPADEPLNLGTWVLLDSLIVTRSDSEDEYVIAVVLADASGYNQSAVITIAIDQQLERGLATS